MAIIDNLLPLSQHDIVAILDSSGNQLLTGETRKSSPFGNTLAFSIGSFLGGTTKAEPMKAFVMEDSKGFTHPLESNRSITDHRIILPIVIEMQLSVTNDKSSEIYKELRGLYFTAETVQVRTRSETYKNMYVARIPHDESVARFNALIFDVTFREIQVEVNTVAAAQAFSPANPLQADTVERGEINGQVN